MMLSRRLETLPINISHPARPDEERDDCDGTDQHLPDARARVDELHGIDKRAPVELLDEPGDRDVEWEHVVGDHQVGVDREEYEDDQGRGSEPAPGGGPWLTCEHLGRRLFRCGKRRRGVLGQRAHRGRLTFNTLTLP
jgi:hypothetical protein